MEQTSSLNPLTRFLRGQGKTRYLIKKADHVITSSPFLNDYAIELNEKKLSTFISSSIDVNRFIPVNKYENKSVPIIGWTGTFSSKEYLDLLHSSLFELSKKIKFKLKLIEILNIHCPVLILRLFKWTKKMKLLILKV